MKRYKLLKDLPGIKSGVLLKKGEKLIFNIDDANIFPEFFELISNTDELFENPAESKCQKDKLRDKFAASAMQALVSGNLKRFENPTNEADIYVPLLTGFAYNIAENMLITRSKYVRES